MNPVSNVSSCQDIMPLPEAGEKSEGTGSTEKPLEGLAEGRRVRVFPAAEGNALAVASTEQGAGAAEPAGRVLSCREAVQKAASGVASAMPVDRTDSEQTQLQCESEIIDKPNDKLKEIEAGPVNKSVNENRHQAMLEVIEKADELRCEGKLKEARELVESAIVYYARHNVPVIGCNAYRSKAYICCAEGDVDTALFYFRSVSNLTDAVNFPDEFCFLHLMLGIDVIDGNGPLSVFQPDNFYEQMKRLLVNAKKHQGGLSEFMKKVSPEEKAFYDDLKAIFEEKNVDAGASRCFATTETFEQPLTLHKKIEPFQMSLLVPGRILKFLENLRLIKRGCFNRVIENITQFEPDAPAPHGLEYLNKYIHCHLLRKQGQIDQAITECEEGIEMGYPFSPCLSSQLRLEKEEMIWRAQKAQRHQLYRRSA